jgi:LPXTG-motif cell wall-anchored protein
VVTPPVSREEVLGQGQPAPVAPQAAPQAAVAAPHSVLPNTGSGASLGITLAGLGSLAAGAVLMLASRRRRFGLDGPGTSRCRDVPAPVGHGEGTMKWLIIILVILAILLLAALVWSVARRKKEESARERASELRSEAAGVSMDRPLEEARAREAQAEADRARAQADQLERQAAEQQRSYDLTRAEEEDRSREADREDPDVDNTADDYQPGATPPRTEGGEHPA